MQAREFKAKAGAQLAQVRTVHNFVDSDGTCHAINSPRSLKAIWLEGFTPAELKPVTREAIAARYKERTELVDIRTEHAQKKVAAKLHVARQRRDRIIKEEEHEAAKKAAGLAAMTMEFGEGQDPAAMDKGQQTIAKLAQEAQALQSRMMELEAKAVASMKVRQKKELDRMVQGQREMVELQRKIAEGEQKEIQRKIEHAKKVEAQRNASYAKRVELEKKQKARADVELQRRKVLHEAEEAREKAIAEVEAANLVKWQVRQRERDAEYKEKMIVHNAKMEVALKEHEELAYERMAQMQVKTERVEKQLAEKHAKKRREIAEARAQAEKRIGKAVQMGKQILIDKRERYDAKQEAARLRKMERQKEEDEKTRELAEAHQKKVDARNARLEGAKQGFVDHRVSIVERRKDKEQYYGVVRAERLARLEEKKLRTVLEEEDRVESINRRARLDEVTRDLRIEDVNSDMRRAAQLNEQRQGLIEMRRSTARDAAMRKARVKEVVEQMKINNNFEDMDRMLASAERGGKRPQSAPRMRARSDD